MFNRVLIANRGEIAVRIIRACKEMGIESVAVYSTVDGESMHVKIADKKICIGPPSPAKSYLDFNNIIGAAQASKCDAIHPGYGFLSENADFQRTCIDNDISFIGPPPDIIELAGNKSEVLKYMEKNGVPTIPGSLGNLKDLRHAKKTAKRLRYPVILKASFGGGGKGMRICKDEKELEDFFPIASSESISSFGQSSLYMEKYLVRPRHIEFQIIADKEHNISCVGARECSIQRRHQKLLEEAPPVGINQKLLAVMKNYAIRAAKALSYENVGTIEFLLDSNNDFYFIEVNTRIQVEHPVTEMVTGLDLIKEQISLASGKKNMHLRNDETVNGHSIEFRINAEDPEEGFKPSPGMITDYFLPGGPGIRTDTFIHSNYEVLPFYDSLIAKLVVWGRDRDEAISRSKRALDEFRISGINTTIPFHKKILQKDNFISGKLHTHFIEEEFGI